MSDARFDAAVARVLQHEGGFVDNKADPGGATNWGVSLRTALATRAELQRAGVVLDVDGDGDVDADDIRALPRATAVEIYRRQWWDRYGYGRLDLWCGSRVFGFAVNMGARQAHVLLQRALRAADRPMVEDGQLGPATVAASIAAGQAVLLPALRSEAAGFYRGLVAARPASSVFLTGWLNRAYD